MDPWSVSVWVALGAGLLSFLSPCVLPLIPAYLSYLGGSSLQEVDRGTNVAITYPWWNALAFVSGFSVIFIAFGLSASVFGQVLVRNQLLLRQVSGVMIVFLGLHLIGLVKLPWLYRERRFRLVSGRVGPFHSLLMGMAFSAGWTPCIGPTLGSVLLVASNSATVWQGGYLLAVYSAGLALPFLTVSLGVNPTLKWLKKWSHLLPLVSVLSGVLMVTVGVMIFTNFFSRLSGLFFFNI